MAVILQDLASLPFVVFFLRPIQGCPVGTDGIKKSSPKQTNETNFSVKLDVSLRSFSL